jgi:uncharacterized protein YhhL (DUF1145 family)
MWPKWPWRIMNVAALLSAIPIVWHFTVFVRSYPFPIPVTETWMIYLTVYLLYFIAFVTLLRLRVIIAEEKAEGENNS